LGIIAVTIGDYSTHQKLGIMIMKEGNPVFNQA
jgi:hypothetical protein